MTKVTAPVVKGMKAKGERIVCLTAYDYISGLLADEALVDVVLVGDSLGTVIQGGATTTKVTLEEVAYHVLLVRAGVARALLVADLPLGSYGSSVAQAVDSAVTLVRAGAEAVKLEGDYCDEILAITRVGIPVMGHLGMTPQSVNVFGGHKVQGRGDGRGAIVEQAKRLEDAGAFGLVLELMDAEAAAVVTKSVGIPTIGIGAGLACDGQIQVFHDILGLWPKLFKHTKRYTNGHSDFLVAIQEYASEVRTGKFPSTDNSF